MSLSRNDFLGAQIELMARANPMAWFETYGTIMGPKREPLRWPELIANKMQREEDEVIRYCEARDIPCKIIKLKGRRQGSSTGSLAQMAHRVRRKPTAAIICGLEYQKNVKVMEEIFWRFCDEDKLPWGVKAKRLRGQGGEWSNGSKLTLITANNPDAGKGDGAQFVLMTEAAYYPVSEKKNDADLFRSLFQLVPREGGSVIIIESTPKGEGGRFHETWVGAISFEDLKAGRIPENWNGFVKLFYPWHEHPGYRRNLTLMEELRVRETLSEREEELMAEFPHIAADLGRLAWRRAVIAGPDFLGDEAEFEREYPSDEIRCFAGSGTGFFDGLKLKHMRDHCREGETGKLAMGPDEFVDFVPGLEGAWCRVWERPKDGFSYWISVDTMTGELSGSKDSDNHAVLVWRSGHFGPDGWVPPAIVARLADVAAEGYPKNKDKLACRWDTDIVESRLALLAQYYGCAPMVIETNQDNGLQRSMRAYGWATFYKQERENEVETDPKEIYGWRTTTKNRLAMLEPLKAAIRQWRPPGKRLAADADGVDIWDARILREFSRFIVKDNGRIEAGAGAKDDSVMSAAIGLATKHMAKIFRDRRAYILDGGAFRDQGRPRDQSFGL